METEKVPTNEPPQEEVISFKKVVNYLYNSGFQAGRDAGYEDAKRNISFSRRAYIYSGHFVFGFIFGGLIGTGIALVLLKSIGVL